MYETIIHQYKSIPNWQIGIEIVVFIFGILSVYFAKKENILVYPTGIICTILSVYITSTIFKEKGFLLAVSLLP